jgi:magnesium chelatase family protein
MARRIPSILPNLTFDEALETTKIHSIAGEIEKNTALITTRPFRAPHHTISGVSLIGGGRIPKPGEISLAHNGVLFLDELPEFNKNTLEVLRGPLEDKIVTISRINATLTYPCNFMFVASMNPCPCGYFGSKDKECTCSPQAISKYIGRISGPLLDRIDIQIEVTPVKYQKLDSKEKVESSEDIKLRVGKARELQQERYLSENIYSNSQLTPKLIEKYCKLDSKSKNILELAFNKLGLSARAYGRILKVARTIADLEQSKNIETNHIAEAIQYRSLDKKYWKN